MTVLSLDGGGVRGLFGLFILEAYQHHLDKAHERMRLRDKFADGIVGCSAGSILGALVAFDTFGTKSTEELLRLLPQVFAGRTATGPVFDTLYDGRGKRAALTELFGAETKLCTSPVRLVVCCTNLLDGSPLLYDSKNKEHGDVLLVDVLDASSAVPVMFPAVRIRNVPVVDGSLHFINPVLVALQMVLETLSPAVDRKIFSIGYARSPEMKEDLMYTERQGFGLCSLVTNGFFRNLAKDNNPVPMSVAKHVLGDGNVCRVEATKYFAMDAVGQEVVLAIKKDSNEQWTVVNARVCKFLSPDV